MSESVKRFSIAILLSAASIALLWLADTIVHEAQVELATTFEYPFGIFLLGAVVAILAGAAVGFVFVLDTRTRQGSAGPIYLAALPPALILANFLLFLGGFGQAISFEGQFWLFSTQTFGATSFAVGALLSVAIVRTISRDPLVE